LKINLYFIGFKFIKFNFNGLINNPIYLLYHSIFLLVTIVFNTARVISNSVSKINWYI